MRVRVIQLYRGFWVGEVQQLVACLHPHAREGRRSDMTLTFDKIRTARAGSQASYYTTCINARRARATATARRGVKEDLGPYAIQSRDTYLEIGT